MRYIEESNASSDGQIQENELEEYLQIPLDRYSLFGRGHIELSDNVRAFAQVMFSQSETEQRQAASPMLGGWRASAPHGEGVYEPSLDAEGNTLPEYLPGGQFGLECPPVGGCTKSQAFPTPPELTALLDSREDPEADWEFRQTTRFADPRRSHVDVSSYQIVGGLEGSFPIRDWTWEAYASSGQTFTESTYGGGVFARALAFRDAAAELRSWPALHRQRARRRIRLGQRQLHERPAGRIRRQRLR